MSKGNAQPGRIRRLEDGHHEGTLERIYPGHDREAVWHMLTDPSALGQWLAPGTIEPRQGGRARIDFADSGTLIDSEVSQYETARTLAYSWSSGNEPQRPLRWQLEDVGGGTRLTLTVVIPAGEDAAKACAGFEGHLEMLGAALEGVPIKFPLDLYLEKRAAYRAQVDTSARLSS